MEANKNIVKIEASHCYRCGNLFENLKAHPERKKTFHHAIPQFLNPDRNFLIPICIKCHQEMNMYYVQSLPKLKTIEGFIDNLEKFLIKYKGIIAKYKVEEGEQK